MDYDYIRLLMLYSDAKYPFEKAKADPGLSEGLRSVNKFMQNNRSRRLNNNELREVVLREQMIKRQVRDIDEQYIPKPKERNNE